MKTDFFYKNSKRLLNESGCDAIILASNKIMLRNGDNVYKFRQNSSFWYYSGLSEPNCTLVITRDEYFVVMPKFDRGEVIMDGKSDDYRPTTNNQNVKVYQFREGSALMAKITSSAKKVGMIVPSSRRDSHHQPNDSGRKLYQSIRRKYPSKKITDISRVIIDHRAVKQSYELDKIKSACAITVNAFNEIHSKIKQYEYEYQIEADLSQIFRSAGADIAYPVIVASGDNASQIHNFLNRSKLSKNSLVVIDAGAEVENYAADVTRTYFLGAKPSLLVLDLYQATANLKKYAEKLISPGVSWRDYEIAVEEKAGELLKNLGLIKTLDRKSIREFYPHATSHLLGLDVHDVGDYRSPMQKNMVITIEPGFYSRRHGFGMRIEDDYLINDNGVVNLTGDLSSELR